MGWKLLSQRERLYLISENKRQSCVISNIRKIILGSDLLNGEDPRMGIKTIKYFNE